MALGEETAFLFPLQHWFCLKSQTLNLEMFHVSVEL